MSSIFADIVATIHRLDSKDRTIRSNISYKKNILEEMIRSPFEKLKSEILIWKFYAIFDIETNSKIKRKLFRIYSLSYITWFCYIGFALHFGSVIYADTIREASETLYVCVSYGNAVTKIMIAYPNRDSIKKLYDKIIRFRADERDDEYE